MKALLLEDIAMKKLLYILLLLCSISLTAQEVGEYQIQPIQVVPGLSAVQTLQGGTFQLQPIDLTVDLRMQALRKQKGFNMRQEQTKVATKFKIPDLSPKKQEPKKGVQFSADTRAQDYSIPFSNNYGYGNSFYGRRYVPFIPRVNQ